MWRSADLPAGGPGAIAVLDASSFGQGFVVTRIDDRPRGAGWFTRYELTPGPRSVTAAPGGMPYRGSSLTRYFDAQAGKTYQVVYKADAKAMRWTFWIVDTESQARVDTDGQGRR